MIEKKNSPSKSFTYNFNARRYFFLFCLIIYIYKVNLVCTTLLIYNSTRFFVISRNYINDSWVALQRKRNKNIFKAHLWKVKTKPVCLMVVGEVKILMIHCMIRERNHSKLKMKGIVRENLLILEYRSLLVASRRLSMDYAFMSQLHLPGVILIPLCLKWKFCVY